MKRSGKSSDSVYETNCSKLEEIISKYYPEEPLSEIPKLYKASSLQQSISDILVIIDFTSRSYGYVSPNIKEVLACTADELVTGGLAKGIKLFPQEEQMIFTNEIMPRIYQVLDQTSKLQKDVSKLRFQYNIGMFDSSYNKINTMHVIRPFEPNKAGMPHYGVKYIFNISDYSITENIKFKVEYLHDDKSSEIIMNDSFLLSRNQSLCLSKREQEIIQYLEKGYISKEIADKLSISVNTVNNHRKNILQKYKAANVHQLVRQVLEK